MKRARETGKKIEQFDLISLFSALFRYFYFTFAYCRISQYYSIFYCCVLHIIPICIIIIIIENICDLCARIVIFDYTVKINRSYSYRISNTLRHNNDNCDKRDVRLVIMYRNHYFTNKTVQNRFITTVHHYRLHFLPFFHFLFYEI